MIVLVMMLLGSHARAQTVIITDDPDYEAGEASAVLDVKSETGGFLPPRMTQAQRDAIAMPATGLLVYQLDGYAGFYYNAGSPEEPAWHIFESISLVIEKPLTGQLWDVDGNHYTWVRIGERKWMASNLRVTHFRSGEPISAIVTSAAWASADHAACSSYDNLASLAGEFGLLYNGYAVNHPDGLCPEGWEVPVEADWQALAAAAGGELSAGPSLKAARHWQSVTNAANNQLGFAALPAGKREANTGHFTGLRNAAKWWSSQQVTAEQAIVAGLKAESDNFLLEVSSLNAGLSVRCVKQTSKQSTR